MNGGARRRRKEARAGEIVDAARDEFVARGFSEARIDDIAARAGVSKGLVYVYFPSKEALFEAVIRSTVLPIIDQAAALIAADRTTPAPDQFRMAIGTFYRELVGTDRRRLIHMIIAEGPRFPDMARFYHAEVLSKGKAALRALIERGVARGEFRAGALSRFPEILIGPALIAAVWKLLFEPYEPIDLDAYMEAHIDTMLSALLA